MFTTYLSNKVLNFTEHHLLPSAAKVMTSLRQRSFTDIGLKKLSSTSPRALVINISTAIPYYIEGDFNRCPHLHKHALYWEVGELVRQLNEAGYVVDFVDCYKVDAVIDWQKYSIVFDERNNLMFAPRVEGQKRVYYSTGLQWGFHNQQELCRVDWFHQRTGIRSYPQRFLVPNYSDEFADFQTYYGRDDFLHLFAQKPAKVPLNVSCTLVPQGFTPSKRKPNRFVWFGSSGSLHKGLDLVVEAFMQMPENELLIFGPANKEPLFFAWLKGVLSKYPNIIYHGIADLQDKATVELLQTAVGNVFPSCSEGGPGSVAQAALLGLVPFVTPTANVRCQDLGYVVDGSSAESIIASIVSQVRAFGGLSEANMRENAEAVFIYAQEHHTRTAYQKSLHTFLNTIL